MCRPEVICGSPTSCEGESRHSEVRHPDGTFSAICRSPPDASFRSWISVCRLRRRPPGEHAHRACLFRSAAIHAPKLVVFTLLSLAVQIAGALLVLCSCSARAQVVLRSRRGRDLPPPTTPPPPSPLTDRLRRSLARPTRRSGSAPRHWVGICAFSRLSPTQ